MSMRFPIARSAGTQSRLFCLVAFCMALSIGLVNLGLVFHANETLGFSPSRIGWLPSLNALCYVVTCLFVVPYFQRCSPRRAVIAALGVLTVCFVAMGFGRRYGVLLTLSAIFGVSLAFFWPFLMGWLSLGREGRSLGRLLSYYNFSWCAAAVVSPYVCGRLSEADSRLPLLVGAGLAAVAVGLIGLFTAPVAAPTKAPPDGDNAGPEVRSAGRSTWLRYPAWAGLAISFLGMGVFSAAFPVATRETLGLSLPMIGLLLLVRAAANMVAFLALGLTERWHFRLGPMVAGQVFGIMAFAGLMAARTPLAIGLCLGLAGFSTAVAYSYSVFHGVSGAESRSFRMAIHEAMLAMGLMIGGAGGAMLYDAHGMRLVYLTVTLLMAGGTIVQAVLGVRAGRVDRGVRNNGGST